MYRYLIEYLEQKFELVRLEVTDKFVRSAGHAGVLIALIISLIFAILFLNVGIALWLGKVLGSYGAGLLIVALFYFVVCWVIYFYRNTIQKKIANGIIHTLKSKKK